MYELDLVLAVLKNRIGFISTSQIPLDAGLSQSDTGFYFNDNHELLTPKMLKSVTPREDDDDQDEATRRNNYLRRLRDSSIAEVLNRFFTEKILRETTIGTDKSRTLYTDGVSTANKSRKTDSTVGWRLVTGSDDNLVTEIRRVSFHGDTADSIVLKLYNSELGEIESVVLEYDTPNKVKWFEVNFKLKNYDPQLNYSCSDWFIGYDYSAYAGEAINRGLTWLENCRGCGTTYHYNSYLVMKGNSIHLCPVSFQNSQGYDIAYFSKSLSDNFGLNLDIWSGCDYTQFLVDNAKTGMFDQAIYKYVGVKLMNYVINNPASKIDSNTSRVDSRYDFIQMEIIGNKEAGIKGMVGEANEAIEAMHVNTEGLSSRCFQKDNRRTIIISSR